jgi:hypothetical protein
MTLPAIETRPARTSCSTARRDPSPAPLNALLSRTGSAPSPEDPPGPDAISGCLRPRSRSSPRERSGRRRPVAGASAPPGGQTEAARRMPDPPASPPARPEPGTSGSSPTARAARRATDPPRRPLPARGDRRPTGSSSEFRADRRPRACPPPPPGEPRPAESSQATRADRRPRACPPPPPGEPRPAESSPGLRVDRLSDGSSHAVRAELRPRGCPPGGRDERRVSGASRGERGVGATRCAVAERRERGAAGSAPDRRFGPREGAGCWPPSDRGDRRGGDPDPVREPGGRGRLPSSGVRFRPAEVMAAPGARPGRCPLGGSP